MMKTILILLFALSTLQASVSPEDMYSIYDKDGKYRAMEEQVDRINQQIEEAEREKNEKIQFILGISTLIGLIPAVAIGRKIIKNRSWKTNPSGMWQALGIALAGGLALFAINFTFLYLRFIYHKEFDHVFSIAIGAILIGGAIFFLKKKK